MIFRIYSEPSAFGRNRRLAIIENRPDGRYAVAEPIQFRLYEPHEAATDFTIQGFGDRKIADEILQAFLDHAWELGMRPAGFADTTEQVNALKGHLEDMRTLVFEQAGAKKP